MCFAAAAILLSSFSDFAEPIINMSLVRITAFLTGQNIATLFAWFILPLYATISNGIRPDLVLVMSGFIGGFGNWLPVIITLAVCIRIPSWLSADVNDGLYPFAPMFLFVTTMLLFTFGGSIM
jgi:hypothetical protein